MRHRPGAVHAHPLALGACGRRRDDGRAFHRAILRSSVPRRGRRSLLGRACRRARGVRAARAARRGRTSRRARTSPSSVTSSTRRSRARSPGVAYSEGARRADVTYLDVHVRRSRIAFAPDEAVGWAPPWMIRRVVGAGRAPRRLRQRHGGTGSRTCSPVSTRSGSPTGAPATRSGVPSGTPTTAPPMPWVVVAFPTRGWANQVFGEPDVERLWTRSASPSVSTSPTRRRPGTRPMWRCWSGAR